MPPANHSAPVVVLADQQTVSERLRRRQRLLLRWVESLPAGFVQQQPVVVVIAVVAVGLAKPASFHYGRATGHRIPERPLRDLSV